MFALKVAFFPLWSKGEDTQADHYQPRTPDMEFWGQPLWGPGPGFNPQEKETVQDEQPRRNDCTDKEWQPRRSGGKKQNWFTPLKAGFWWRKPLVAACPSKRWSHSMCLSDPDTAVLIGGETAAQQYCTDSLWKLELGQRGWNIWLVVFIDRYLWCPSACWEQMRSQ